MRALFLAIFLTVAGVPAAGQSVTVEQPVRAGDILTAGDLAFIDLQIADGFADPRALDGLEARVNLYPGRPIRQVEVGARTVIRRNAVVPLVFTRGGLTITLEGRALQPAGDGESLRVMNLSSRMTVMGVATAAGTVVERNAIVPLVFRRGGLSIQSEGRALDRAGDGDVVRVMNLSSRQTVTGVATASGAVVVQ
jgi:flagella basal body P-ring formation protein FlgA